MRCFSCLENRRGSDHNGRSLVETYDEDTVSNPEIELSLGVSSAIISCMRELSLFVLLITPANRVLTTLLFQYNEKGWNQYANGINLLIIIVVLLINLAINKITGASIDKGIGS